MSLNVCWQLLHVPSISFCISCLRICSGSLVGFMQSTRVSGFLKCMARTVIILYVACVYAVYAMDSYNDLHIRIDCLVLCWYSHCVYFYALFTKLYHMYSTSAATMEHWSSRRKTLVAIVAVHTRMRKHGVTVCVHRKSALGHKLCRRSVSGLRTPPRYVY